LHYLKEIFLKIHVFT